MLTVIIAPAEINAEIKENKLFLEVLSCKEDIAFCDYYCGGQDLQEMVPGLTDLIANQPNWKAIVVTDSYRNQVNPFDYTGYTEEDHFFDATNLDEIVERRNNRFECYEKAANNPLLKLLCGLSETAYSRTLLTKEEYDELTQGNLSEYRFMLRKRLDSLNTDVVAYNMVILSGEILEMDEIDFESNKTKSVKNEQSAGKVPVWKPKNPNLLRLLDYSTVKYGNVVEALKQYSSAKEDGEDAINKVLDVIFAQIGRERIFDFNRIIGGDLPEYTDPEFVESKIFNFKKSTLIKPIEERYSLHNIMPDEVICISLRNYDMDVFRDNKSHISYGKSIYSRFVEFNMYPSNTKFITYDIIDESNVRYNREFVKFLSVILLVANHGFPSGSLSGGYLYYLCPQFNDEVMGAICGNYIGKLNATIREIEFRIRDVRRGLENPISDEESEKEFESPVQIPIVMRANNLESKLNINADIGLAGDCPKDELIAWNGKTKEVDESFERYMREPSRAIKASISSDFKEKNSISDERILQMSEYQLENVEYAMSVDEKKLMDTETSDFLFSREYVDKLKIADVEVKDEMGNRMSRKTTVLTGLLALLMLLFGILPYVFKNNFSLYNRSHLAIVAIVSIVLFFIPPLIGLYYYRYRLNKRISDYNGILTEVKKRVNISLRQFSEYLGHACDMMRKASVLKVSKERKESRIINLTKNKKDIQRKVAEVYHFYAGYIDDDSVKADVEPYDFDFTKSEEYDYLPDQLTVEKEIPYIENGNSVIIPVEYVDEIMLKKEDLYD